jgi:predicted secreted Zn-dependent protease
MKYGRSTGRVRFGVRVRRYIWLPALTTTALAVLYLILASTFVRVASSQPTLVSAATTRPSTIAASCVPSTFSSPSGIDLATAPSGLSISTDAPAHYRIYGDTANQIRTEIQVCAPGAHGSGGAEYTGETSYTMSWQYDTIRGTSCIAANVKVGMHIGTSLPLWQPTRTTTPGLDKRWDAFMSALTTHEAGHAELDRQYATRLLSDLNALPPMDCERIGSVAKSVVSADMRLLDQANDSYDASTEHGATQGAVLPSR